MTTAISKHAAALALVLAACNTSPAGSTPAASVATTSPPPHSAAPTSPPPPATSAPPPKPSTSASSAPADPSAPVAGHKYALVVSFFSPGDGTDSAAAKRLDDLIAKTTPKPSRVSSPWGREGEHDECFDLGELGDAAKASFIAAVKKEVAAPSKKVNVSTNAVCQSR